MSGSSSLFAGICISVASLCCWSTSANAVDPSSVGTMTPVVVTTHLDAISTNTRHTSEAFTLSPDGTLVAHLRIETGPPPIRSQTLLRRDAPAAPLVVGKGSLEILRPATSNVVATYSIPAFVDPTNRWEDWNRGPAVVQYCDNGKYLVASAGVGKVYILETETYQPYAVIDLDAVKLPPPYPYDGRAPDQQLLGWQFDCAANGNIAAFQMEGGRFGKGVVKVFDLDSGAEITGVDELSQKPLLANIAISASGTYLAIIQDDRNPSTTDKSVLIYDLRDKTIAGRISVPDNELHTHQPHVWFVGESKIAMKRQRQWIDTTSDAKFMGNLHKDSSNPATLACWDIATGKMLDTNAYPDAAGIGLIDISADGKTVLSDTGSSNWCSTCNHNEGKFEISAFQLTFWDRATARAIAQTPRLRVIHHHDCFPLQLFGCMTEDESPWVLMSRDGDAALVGWRSPGNPILLYTIRH